MVRDSVHKFTYAHFVSVVTSLYEILTDGSCLPPIRVCVGQTARRDRKSWKLLRIQGECPHCGGNLILGIGLELRGAVVVAGREPSRAVGGEDHSVALGREFFLDKVQHLCHCGRGCGDGRRLECLEGV